MNPDVVVVASWNADLTSRVARPPLRGETLMGHGFEVGPGGKGSNAAVAAARQGARVAVVARIGRDDFGCMALALWAREGIVTDAVAQAANEPSGVAQIFTYPDGDNSIVVSPGANAGLDAAQVRAAAPYVDACRVTVASFEVPLDAVTEAFRSARAGGALVESLAGKVQVVVYLSPELGPSDRASLVAKIKNQPVVRSVEERTSEEALLRFKALFPDLAASEVVLTKMRDIQNDHISCIWQQSRNITSKHILAFTEPQNQRARIPRRHELARLPA